MKKIRFLICFIVCISFINVVHAETNRCTLQDTDKWVYEITLDKDEAEDKVSSGDYDHSFCCTESSGEEVCDLYSKKGSLGGSVGDPYPDNGFSPIEKNNNNKCSIFINAKTGEYNEFYEFLQGLFTLIKIAAPVLVIALSTIDYIKALASSNADEMKKVTQRTIKRAVIGLIVFFLPFLLDILFELFGLYDISGCNIGM